MLEVIASLIAIVIIVLIIQVIRLDGITKEIEKFYRRSMSRPWHMPEPKTPNQIRAEYGLGLIHSDIWEKRFTSAINIPTDENIEERFNAIIGRSAPTIMLHTDNPQSIKSDDSLSGASAALLEYSDEIKRWKGKYCEVSSQYNWYKGNYDALERKNKVLETENERLKTFEAFVNNLNDQPHCNNCSEKRTCAYCPGLGGSVRYNCPLHPEAQVRPFVHIRVSPVFKKEN